MSWDVAGLDFEFLPAFPGCQQLVLGTTILSDSDVLRDLDGLHGSLAQEHGTGRLIHVEGIQQ